MEKIGRIVNMPNINEELYELLKKRKERDKEKSDVNIQSALSKIAAAGSRASSGGFNAQDQAYYDQQKQDIDNRAKEDRAAKQDLIEEMIRKRKESREDAATDRVDRLDSEARDRQEKSLILQKEAMEYKKDRDEKNDEFRRTKAETPTIANKQKERELKIKEDAVSKGPDDEPLNEAQKYADKEYVKVYTTFTNNGRNNAVSAINKLKDLAKEMEGDSGTIQSGGGRIASILPDVLRDRDSIRRRDDTRNAANTTLKELFGGQLSDAEREAAAKEYYNDDLDNADNAKILRRKIAELEGNLVTQTAKASYYEKHNTTAGFSGVSGEGATQLKEDKDEEDQEDKPTWAK